MLPASEVTSSRKWGLKELRRIRKKDIAKKAT
jgi:hypothetical protein